MTYIEILAARIKKREIDFPRAVDFLVEHGIHELTAIKMLVRASR